MFPFPRLEYTRSLMSGTVCAAALFINAEIQRQFAEFFGKGKTLMYMYIKLNYKFYRSVIVFDLSGFNNVNKVEIEPFLSVLQRIKAEYNKEVWHMILQLLYDYLHYKDGFRLPKQKVKRLVIQI